MKNMVLFIIAMVMLVTPLMSEATTFDHGDMFSRESIPFSSEVLKAETDTETLISASGTINSAMAHAIVFGFNYCRQDYDIYLSMPCGVCKTAYGIPKPDTCDEKGKTPSLNSNMFSAVMITYSHYNDNVSQGPGNDFIYDSIDLDSASIDQNTKDFPLTVYEAVPVPEPSHMLLIGMGLMGIDAFRRTLRKK